MVRPGESIVVARSVVTGIRIDPGSGTLVVEGVDQDAEGRTLDGHRFAHTASDRRLSPERAALVDDDWLDAAIRVILAWAQREIDAR